MVTFLLSHMLCLWTGLAGVVDLEAVLKGLSQVSIQSKVSILLRTQAKRDLPMNHCDHFQLTQNLHLRR